MSLGPYASFIVASYILVALVIISLIVWVASDYRRQLRMLRELETSGVKRRSAKSSGKTSGKSPGKSK